MAWGKGRTDLLVVWLRIGVPASEYAMDRFVIECKALHGSLERTVREGLEQTTGYMGRYGNDEGHLVIFDLREKAVGG